MKEVLVVEDNPVNRELIREILELRGYSVREAQDGGQAIHELRSHQVQVAIIDIQMPRVSGLGLIQQIRSDPVLSGTRCLALTAYAMQGDRERMLDAGFDAYLTKPFNAKELLQTIEDLAAR